MISRRRDLLSVLVALWAAAAVLPLAAQEAPVAPPVETELDVTPGWQHQSIEGNERRFDQYVTPASGLYLSELMLRRLDVSGGPMYELLLDDLGEPGAAGSLYLYSGNYNLSSLYRRSTFYLNFGPAEERLRRRDYFVNLQSRVHPEPNYSWLLDTREVSTDGGSAALTDWRDRRHTGALGLRTGGYWLDFGLSREEFDPGDVGFSGHTTNYGFSFSPAVSHKASLSGFFAGHSTDLDDFSGGVRSWNAGLTLTGDVRDDLIVTTRLRHFSIDRTINRSAYAQEQTSGRFEAEYRPARNTTVDAFWQAASTDYVDGLQTSLVDVGSNTCGLGVRSRLTDTVKFSGKFTRYDTNNLPLFHTIDGSPAATLIYSTLKRLDLSATYSPNKPYGVSAQWQRHSWDNEAQGIGSSVETTALTGWWQRGKLSLTGSLLRQDFDLPLIDLASQEGYASRADSLVLGASYAASDRDNLYVSYTDAEASGATSNEYRRLTLGASRELSPTGRVSAEMNLGDFWDDRESDLDYDANLYRVEYRHEF